MVDLVGHIENQCKQRHPHENTVIRLPENRKVGVIIEIVVELLSTFARISRKRMHDDRIRFTEGRVNALV